MAYLSTKTYGHEVGLSVAFRQHRAESHCRFIHGYALSVKFTFAAEVLDENGWVMDFGGLKDIKSYLQDLLDHRLLVAEDDPMKDELCALAGLGVADVIVLPATGCEAFAKAIFTWVEFWLYDNNHAPRVTLVSVEVKEHGANSAIYTGQLDGRA